MALFKGENSETGSKEALEQAIKDAENKLDALEEELKKKLQEAIDQAKRAKDDQQATDQSLKDAIDALNNVQQEVEALQKLKDDLQAALDAAEKRLAQLGDAYKTALNEAIAAGQGALDAKNQKIEDLERAIADLQEALKKADVQKAIEEAVKQAEEAANKQLEQAIKDALEQAKAEADAVAKDKDAALKDLQEKLEALEDALKNAGEEVKTQAEKELEQAIKDAENKLAQLEDAYKQQLQEAIDAANKAKEEAAGDREKLKDALEALEKKQQALEDAIQKAKELEDAKQAIQDAIDALTKDQQEKLQAAIDAANQAKDDANATKDQLEKALKDLEDAIAKLDGGTPGGEGPSKEALEQAIKDAEQALKDLEDEWKQKLQDAIDQANEVKAKQDATEKELKDALDALQKAKDEAKKAQDLADAKQAIEDAINGLTDDQKEQLKDAIDAANDAKNAKDATKESLDKALNDLNDAIAALDKGEAPTGKEGLQAKLKEAEVAKKNEMYYKKQSLADLTKVMEAGQEVLVDENATDEQIQLATNNLQVAIDALVLNEVGYTIDKKDGKKPENFNHKEINFTFEEAIQLPKKVTVGGTVADAKVSLSEDGKQLKVTSAQGAKGGETIQFKTIVGVSEVEVTLAWDKVKWTMVSKPAIFKDQTKYEVAIDLGLLNDGLLSPNLNLEQLTQNDQLLNLKVLPGSGLQIGDVLKLGSFLNVTLQEGDFNDDGTVNLQVGTELVKNLLGTNGAIDLTVTGERDGKQVTDTELLNIPLPVLNPVSDLLDVTTNSVKYELLNGEQPIHMDIRGLHVMEDGSLRTVRAGDEVQLVLSQSGKNPETITIPVTAEDVKNGYVEHTLQNGKGLIASVLNGVVLGEGKLRVKPTFIFKEDGQQVGVKHGEATEITVSQGVVEGLGETLDGVLDHLLKDLPFIGDVPILGGLADVELAKALSGKKEVQVDIKGKRLKEGDEVRLVVREAGDKAGAEKVITHQVTAGDLKAGHVLMTMEMDDLVTSLLKDLALGGKSLTVTPVFVRNVGQENEITRYGAANTIEVNHGLLTNLNGLVDGVFDDLLKQLTSDIPVVGPAVEGLQNTTNDLLSGLLSGKEKVKVKIDQGSLEKLKTGDRVVVDVTSGDENVASVQYTLTAADLMKKEIEVAFTNQDSLLIDNLVGGLLGGNQTLTVTPKYILAKGGVEVEGQPMDVEIDRGLITSLDNVLGNVLVDGLVGKILQGTGLDTAAVLGLDELTGGLLTDGLSGTLQPVLDNLGLEGLVLGKDGLLGGLLGGTNVLGEGLNVENLLRNILSGKQTNLTKDDLGLLNLLTGNELQETLGSLLLGEVGILGDGLLDAAGLQDLLKGNLGLLQLGEGGLLEGLLGGVLSDKGLLGGLLGDDTDGLLNLANLLGTNENSLLGGLLNSLLGENGLLGDKGLLGGALLGEGGLVGGLLNGLLGNKGLLGELGLGNVANLSDLLGGLAGQGTSGLAENEDLLSKILGKNGLLGGLLGKGGLLGGILGGLSGGLLW